MRRRLALAQALLGEPELLVLDEPTAGLDPEQRLRFRELVSEIGEHRTVLLSTHQTEDVAALCHRVVVLTGGEVRFDGSVPALADLARGRVWISDAPGARRPPVLADGRRPHPQHRRPAGRRRPRRTHHRGRLPAAGRRAARRDGGLTCPPPSSSPTSTAPDTTGDGVPAADPPASPGRTAIALARFEGKKLLRHPAFLVGMALTPWLFLMATSDTGETWIHFEVAIALGLVPLGWLTMVAANLGALRSRRHRTEDLFQSLPTSPAVRTAAHNLSTLATVPVAVVFAAVCAVLVQVNADPLGSFGPAELATGVLLVVGGGAVGVLVARWLPRPAVCLPAIGATMFLQGKLTDFSPSPARWLSFVVDPLSSFAAVEQRPAGWHVGWLAAWIALVGVAGVARHGMPRRLGVVALGVAVVALGTGFAQTRPVSAEEAAAMADYISRPAAHQTCREQADVRYCAYDDLGTRLADWRPPVEARPDPAARRRAGTGASRSRNGPTPSSATATARPVGLLSTLPGPVRDRLTPEGVWPARREGPPRHRDLGLLELLGGRAVPRGADRGVGRRPTAESLAPRPALPGSGTGPGGGRPVARRPVQPGGGQGPGAPSGAVGPQRRR